MIKLYDVYVCCFFQVNQFLVNVTFIVERKLEIFRKLVSVGFAILVVSL
jgi:hypothetical protein